MGWGRKTDEQKARDFADACQTRANTSRAAARLVGEDTAAGKALTRQADRHGQAARDNYRRAHGKEPQE